MSVENKTWFKIAGLVTILASIAIVARSAAQVGSDGVWLYSLCGIVFAGSMAMLAIGVSSTSTRLAVSLPDADQTAMPSSSAVQHSSAPANDTPNPLSNTAWVELVEECVSLFDELERLAPTLDAASQEFGDHIACRLREILERVGVTIISDEATFDATRHQADVSRDETKEQVIAATKSPGFAVGQRVFRRARVQLVQGNPEKEGGEL